MFVQQLFNILKGSRMLNYGMALHREQACRPFPTALTVSLVHI